MEQIVKTDPNTMDLNKIDPSKLDQNMAAGAEVPGAGQTAFQPDPSSRNLARAVSHYIQGESGRALQALEGAEAGANESSLTEVTAARAHLQFELQRYEDAA